MSTDISALKRQTKPVDPVDPKAIDRNQNQTMNNKKNAAQKFDTTTTKSVFPDRISDMLPNMSSTPNLSILHKLSPLKTQAPMNNAPLTKSTANGGLFSGQKFLFGQTPKSEVTVNTSNTTSLSRSFGNLLNNINTKVSSAVHNILPPLQPQQQQQQHNPNNIISNKDVSNILIIKSI